MNSISDIVSESLKLAYKHKILWVFALLLTANGNVRLNNFDFSDFANKDTQENNQLHQRNIRQPEEAPEFIVQESVNAVTVANASEFKFDRILGSTDASEDYINDFRAELKRHSPPYIILGTIILVLAIIIGLGLAFFLQSWATGSFLGGITDAIYSKHYTLTTLGFYGRHTVKKYFKYKVSVFIMLLLCTLVPLGLIMITVNLNLEILGLILTALTVILYLLFLVSFAYTNKFALRYISHKDFEPLHAFKAGYSLFKKNIGIMLLLSVVNFFVLTGIWLVMLFAVGIPVFIIILVSGLLISIMDNFAVIGGIILGLFIWMPLGIGGYLFITAFTAFFYTYNNFTWSKLYFNSLGEVHDNA